jgi:hypothetical protein
MTRMTPAGEDASAAGPVSRPAAIELSVPTESVHAINGVWRSLLGMSLPPGGKPQHSVSTEELLAAAGIEVTEEGKRRARERLDRAAEARTPERREALRAKVGLPPRSSAA